MQNKKNPKADIGRNSSIYFALGLALMMFMSYATINYKVYDKDATGIDRVNMDALDEEEVPITEQVKPPPPPPPPPPAPEVIEIVEDEEEVEETIIESPVFPGCERGNNEKKRKCMSDKIAKFVQRKFNTDLAGDLGLTGRQRISVIFKIDKSGNVTGVRARAPHPRLEKEAQRVINSLPKMQPGKQRGKAVIVPYSLPIIFQVQD